MSHLAPGPLRFFPNKRLLLNSFTQSAKCIKISRGIRLVGDDVRGLCRCDTWSQRRPMTTFLTTSPLERMPPGEELTPRRHTTRGAMFKLS